MPRLPIPDNLPQIGPATLAVLKRRGLSDNYALLEEREYWLSQVAGIGPGRAAILMNWAETTAPEEHGRLEEQRQQERAAKEEQAALA